MLPDPLAGSEVPDRIPDELIQQYSADARKAVLRRRKPPRRSPNTIVHQLVAAARDGHFWPAIIALAIAIAAAASLVLFGAIGYVVYLWPQAALYVAASLCAAAAVAAVLILARRRRT
jgi:hypothetical protein